MEIEKIIDRLFAKLSVIYGGAWIAMWDGMDVSAVKKAWADEIVKINNPLESIRWALDRLPDRAPNVIQFKNLCLQAPVVPALQLPPPRSEPTQELKNQLTELTSGMQTPNSDPRYWARRIVDRSKKGEQVPQFCLQKANAALAV